MSQMIHEYKRRVGRQIQKARKQAGLSHDALGVAAGTSRQHLIKLEKGMHLPSDLLLARIAAATGKALAFFESELDEDITDPAAEIERGVRGLVREEIRDETCSAAETTAA